MPAEKCQWVQDKWHEYWETGCGGSFVIENGTPKDNKMKFCPYCGKQIDQKAIYYVKS